MKPSSHPLVLMLLALLVLATPGLAHAYIDPGTGSYLVQIIVGAVLGAALAIKLAWSRLVVLFGRVFSGGKKSADGAGDDKA